FKVWKSLLTEGQASAATAGSVARILLAIHAATAFDQHIAKQFSTDDLFFALRTEPYLLATAKRHPDVAQQLSQLADRLMVEKKALVHGDVSPKNILVGAKGPVILDAECAWYGDPAFDVAFCLNHLLLKCLWRPGASASYLDCFAVITESYLGGVDWERREDIERRVAQLLPGLFLGRVDGKSPVEYITERKDKEKVRRVAKRFLLEPTGRLKDIRRGWEEELSHE
ncbi:MAG: phosphotransferase family protein, partial [Pseudomonadales bacterium]